jgi:hypothetical protein
VDAKNRGNIVTLLRPRDLDAGQLRGMVMNRITTIAIGGALALAAVACCGNSGFAQIAIGNGNGNANPGNSGVVAGNGAGNSIGNINSNVNALSSRQTQRQTQANRQSINGTGNSNITENSPTPVPNVFAPGLAAAGSEVCLGSVSGGGSGSGFGVTIGGTFVDRECQLRLNARTLATLGYPLAARETMCLDEDVRRAMYAAGTPCSYDRNGWAGYAGGWASAQPSTQVAAAPAPQPALASQSAPAQQPVATSQPEPASDCPQKTIFNWFTECHQANSEQVSEAAPAPTPSTPAKKHTARAKPAVQSKEANAKKPAHEAEATPETPSTQVASESTAISPTEVTLAHGAIH